MSKFLRRTHLYLALFLGPWVLMYAISTIHMNHKPPGPSQPPRWDLVKEMTYDGVFPDGANHQVIARQLLMSLDLEGAHQSSLRDGKVIIQRQIATQPMRVTFTPETKRVIIERQEPNLGTFLERMHRRRGFQHPYVLDDTWAVTVDVFIVAMVFWALSGLWLWWELKVTRKWGLVAFLAGIALFAIFLAVL